MTDANEIRARRLARLNALAATSNSNTTPPQQPQEQSIDSSQSQQSISISTQSQPSTATTTTDPEKVNEPKTPIENIIPPKVPLIDVSEEDHLSDWITQELEYLFQATLNPDKQKQFIFLNNLSYELKSDPSLRLNEDHIESIFMEILTELGIPTSIAKIPIEYLYLVYHNAFKTKRLIPVKSPFYQQKINFLNKVINFATNYGNICLQVPDMFIKNDIYTSLDFFIRRFADTSSFLIDIIKITIEEDTLLDVLNLLFPYLSGKLYSTNLNERTYLNLVSIFETLVSIKPVAAIFSQITGFQPPSRQNGLDFEHKTLLGPLLRLSPLLDNMATYYFGDNIEQMSPNSISNVYQSIQNEYKVIYERLFSIIDKLIRGSAQTRQDLLIWFGDLVNLSHLRRGSHADFKKLPSDGIMFNISMILIKLSLPILDYPIFPKIDKIDVDYFFKSQLLDIKEESRVNSTIEEANQYYETKRSQITDLSKLPPPNFISDCFNLTLAYLHYGMGGVFIKHDRLKRQIKQEQQRIDMIEQGRSLPNMPGMNPMMISFMRAQLPKMKKSLDQLRAVKHSITAIFSYRILQLDIFDFIVGATTFIVRLIDPSHSYPQEKLSIPIFKVSKVSELDDHDYLKTKTPEPWKYYPEFMVEGIINYCKFSTNFIGCPLVDNQPKLEIFVEFMTVLLRCPELIGNPHMKANLIELLFIGSLPLSNGEPGFISNILASNKLVIDNILYSLLDFYVMVEKTGASSQFYDKFNSRYYISVILEELWKNPLYRHQLTDYSKNNVDFFIRFIARMLNDTTYLLDETFNLLNSIHDYQQELKKRQRGSTPNEELGTTDEELADNLQSSEERAKSYMGLSNKTMELFKLFTKEVPSGFVLPEIVDRLAGMLDYNLSIMVGPKCSNLKVESPEKYDFDPKRILTDLCQIYVNLSSQSKFIIAVARDGRSFNIQYFKKAEQILTTKTYVPQAIITQFSKFATRAEETRIEEANEELELGEVPDEFLDPLMFTIMEDPVILPSSKISIDRATIKAHLLSDSIDPFNRAPLKLEDLVDDVELKRRIGEWKMSRKMQSGGGDGDVEMKDD
ncbi:ufd2 [[Candida] subhashii]|uniref:RING-type E3 ubiquitin transferase n=1 Tax=[Candida] subhashii TaxID=561895 RepID=A0A8J5UMG7_9ASCO|nr:ufd2 [[Candida] subhashii]KAG7663077.1 ufd2 [[Candida] subhashii]